LPADCPTAIYKRNLSVEKLALFSTPRPRHDKHFLD